MRSFVRHGLVVGTFLSALVASAGCEQKKATEYVTGVSTQVTVPRDLKAVRIQIATAGFVQFCQNYKVYDGKVLLPKSLGNFPTSSDGNRNSITFSIVGLTEEFEAGSQNPVFSDCTSSAQVKANNVRILRRSTQPYVPDHILFLPMALKYSCFDKVCDEGKTCKGGLCVDDATDPKDLAEYVDGMGDGTDGACFSLLTCMGAAIPAVPVNQDTCDFGVAESPDVTSLPKDINPFRPACTTTDQCSGRPCNNGQCDLLPPGLPPWTGVNVEVTYDGGHTKEILDLDANEGFTIPDPAKPQTFRLAPGLCAMFKGKDAQGKPTDHRITSIRAAGTCAAKSDKQAICLPDQLKIMGAGDDGSAADVNAKACTTQLLTPAKSALVLVVDNTTGHQAFFQKDVQDQLKEPLSDPAFERTEIGLLLADSTAQCSGQALTLPLKNAVDGGMDDILAKFQIAPSASGDPKMEGAIQSAYDVLGGLDSTYARRAVIVLGNRALDVSTCGDAAIPSATAKARFEGTPTIATFATKLISEGDPTTAQLLASFGSPRDKDGNIPYKFDASGPNSAADKKQALQAAINYLATCLYDVGTAPDAGSTLSYADPLLATEQKIAHVDSCDSVKLTDNGGWTTDLTDAAHPRVKVCGLACTKYQDVLSKTSSFTVVYGQPSLPVPLYVSSKECFGK